MPQTKLPKKTRLPGCNESLSGCRCPYCRLGFLEFRRVENYGAIGIDGKPVAVPRAAVNVCPVCTGHVVTEDEIRRWAAL
jgi:hypothetical protein